MLLLVVNMLYILVENYKVIAHAEEYYLALICF